MTGVGVVIPVVVVGNVVGCIRGRTTLKVRFTCIPEVVVGVSYVVRLLGIKRAVTLFLVGVSACMTVEEVTVVNPDMVIALLETDAVALRAVCIHNCQVADLHVRGVLKTNTKAVYGCILAHTLNGDTNIVAGVVDNNITLIKCSSCTGIGNVTDNTNTERCGHLLDHARRENVGDACICCAVNSRGHAILVAVGNVNHNRAVL